MRVECASCSVPFEAKRQTAKYCSTRCRVRASRQMKSTGEPAGRAVEAEPLDSAAVAAELHAATLAELTAAGREGSALGVAALLLARRLDSPVVEPGSAVAAMVKQHGASLAEALKGAAGAVSPLDELRSRRDRKRAAG